MGNKNTIGFIGFGNIGQALYSGLTSKNKIINNYIVFSKSQNSQTNRFNEKINTTTNIVEFWKSADIIFLAPPSTKVLNITKHAKEIVENQHKVIVSFCAGVPLDKIQDNFSQNQHCIKAVSNINIETNNGYIVVYNPKNTNKSLDDLIKYTINLLESVGKLNQVKTNDMCDIISTSSASLPAFINVIIDGCIDGCIYGGIPKKIAKELVFDVFKGTASNLFESKTSTSTLKQKVTSPGGVVIKGIKEFEKHAPRAAMIDGISTVYDAINNMKPQTKTKNRIKIKAKSRKVTIIGAGIFGLCGAIELARKGYGVTIIEKSKTIPGSKAASKDRSKMIRIDYGKERELINLMLKSVEKWKEWNNEFNKIIFHQEGMLMMSGEKFEDNPDNPDAINYRILKDEFNINLERLDSASLVKRFPAWASKDVSTLYPDGYFNPVDGWCDSMLLMKSLKDKAIKLGITILTNTKVRKIDFINNIVKGVELENGNYLKAEKVILSAGAWAKKFTSPRLPFKPTAQPELYFSPKNKKLFMYPNFTMWAANVTKTGWGGFSALSDKKHNGWVKVDHHGEGFQDIEIDGDRIVPKEHIEKCREFFSKTFPELKDAKLEEANICFYNDTENKNFLIDYHPKYKGLFIASGGSGHSFKFAPLLGDLIANTLDGKKLITKRFLWDSENESSDPLRTAKNSLE